VGNDDGIEANTASQKAFAAGFVYVRDSSERTSQPRVLTALLDLYQLLEDYGPQWYTEEHRRKAQTALFPEKKV
jgi:hypothetical protein